ncbi:nucleotidyltransferase domain-containing protein [Geomonas paludis]|uniref:DNA polymerase n=1 Tax=Geomonas paludis TaxID=2740185 RepID=A0A6V8MZ73_9BACT|nr:nucleotidyltransferase domain-containing protein [Geomonas paludis]UPU34480.1 nucleotidyltransferase domain-containing protein [Geomonas paludis]GFO64469.1 DNA polymerase [Geomonas paludis]
MADDDLIYGLARRHYLGLAAVFSKYVHIDKVMIFGSRAKGTEKPYSDIDLAVIAPEMGSAEFSRLLDELDALDLVFKLDVLHFDTLPQPKLRKTIELHGKQFYPLHET